MEYTVLRATENYQKTGAYSVRIEGMNRAHHISLREEFDEHDFDNSNYIVILDDTYPIATARIYELDKDTATIGRVVVLPEYRGKGLGKLVVTEAEKWIKDLGYKKILINSRLEVIDFYKKLGYKLICEDKCKCGTFVCKDMVKEL